VGRRSEIFGKRISDRNGDVQQSTMARGRARIEWQKEGGRHVGGMLKSWREGSFARAKSRND